MAGEGNLEVRLSCPATRHYSAATTDIASYRHNNVVMVVHSNEKGLVQINHGTLGQPKKNKPP